MNSERGASFPEESRNSSERSTLLPRIGCIVTSCEPIVFPGSSIASADEIAHRSDPSTKNLNRNPRNISTKVCRRNHSKVKRAGTKRLFCCSKHPVSYAKTLLDIPNICVYDRIPHIHKLILLRGCPMDVWKQFEENNITHSAAHHLLAVMELREQRGYARVTDVAKHLNITTGSASTNLKGLKAKGLVSEDDNRFLTLSPEGESLAKAVIARKKIFQRFLTEILKVSEEQAEIDACKTEHLISPETTRKLEKFVECYAKTTH
ncbi:MAG: hypothetical protein DCC75_09080 [Proteobacteria bacterium]|nr:MAG: hypothetical protein DCC75_09080 [Pseudomonadota bacterium]